MVHIRVRYIFINSIYQERIHLSCYSLFIFSSVYIFKFFFNILCLQSAKLVEAEEENHEVHIYWIKSPNIGVRTVLEHAQREPFNTTTIKDWLAEIG